MAVTVAHAPSTRRWTCALLTAAVHSSWCSTSHPTSRTTLLRSVGAAPVQHHRACAASRVPGVPLPATRRCWEPRAWSRRRPSHRLPMRLRGSSGRCSISTCGPRCTHAHVTGAWQCWASSMGSRPAVRGSRPQGAELKHASGAGGGRRWVRAPGWAARCGALDGAIVSGESCRVCVSPPLPLCQSGACVDLRVPRDRRSLVRGDRALQNHYLKWRVRHGLPLIPLTNPKTRDRRVPVLCVAALVRGPLSCACLVPTRARAVRKRL